MADVSTIPTWEMPPGAPSPVNAERAEAFGAALSNVEFSEDGGKAAEKDITAASSIINYGANAACHELGVQGVADKIENFDPSSYDDPIGAFYETLEIDNKAKRDATKQRENENLDPNVSAQKISRENFVQAISDFKDLVAEVKSNPRFNKLNNAASSFGTTVFEIASQKAAESGGEPDFIGALNVLKAEMEVAEENGINPEMAANIIVDGNREEGHDIPEGYYNPEGDEAIRIHELLKTKADDAERIFLQNKELFSEDEQEKFEKTIRNARDAVDGVVPGADKKKLLKDIEELIEEIEITKRGGDNFKTESEEVKKEPDSNSE